MIWSIISSILWSISTIFRKKSLDIIDLPQFLFRFFAEIIWVLIWIILIFIYWFNFNYLWDWKIILAMISIMILVIATDFISQKVYKTEKVSTLLPYENLHNVLAIIAWYFMFKDSSLIAVGVAILVVMITVLSVVDLKKMSLPKNMWLVLLDQSLTAAEVLMTWYFLKQISDTDYFVLYEIFIILMLLLLIFFHKQYVFLKKIPWTFYKNRFSWAIAWNLSFLLYLFLVWEFWVVLSILLSFLWDWITLIFWFIFLWEKPTKKDISLLIVTSILIWIWFYYK